MGKRLRKDREDSLRGEGRAESATEIAKLRERQENLERGRAEYAGARERAEQEVSALTATLAQERERASRLAALLEGSTSTNGQLDARVRSLSELESDLRRDLAARDDELKEQYEATGRLAAQLDAAAIQVDQLTQRLQTAEELIGQLRKQLKDGDTALAESRAEASGFRASLEAAEKLSKDLSDGLDRVGRERDAISRDLAKVRIENGELTTALESEQRHSNEKLGLLLSAREELVNQFKSISADILEEKSKKFTEQNSTALGNLLEPVKEQLKAFHTKVDEVYRTDGQERVALGVQLKQLMQLNQSLSADAQNLTRALKGDQKTQGTWGEIVLDTVLEQAGLIEGTHFDRQAPLVGEEQKRAIPDVVIRLPGDRQLVIDSKVSLTAYERSVSATDQDDRELHVKQHINSLRTHIRSLSEKNYQQLYELKCLDFVILFVPLEPAFAVAVSQDNLIFRDAWDRNVILVSPSTLLFVVRTVAYLWRQEMQARNVVEIAKRGAALYDKLCGFVDELEDVGRRISQTVKAYDGAMRKLAVGDGNVIRQAEMLRDLGVKPSKQLPMTLVDKALSKAQQSLLADDPPDSGAPKSAGVAE
jgi:DNA recombination protein RmuC